MMLNDEQIWEDEDPIDCAGYDSDYSIMFPIDLDELFEEAAKVVVLTQNGSTSILQRRLGVGYSRAIRIIDQLEAAGIIGPFEGSRPRQVFVSDLNELYHVLRLYLPDYHERVTEPIKPPAISHEQKTVERATVMKDYDSSSKEYSNSVKAMNGCLGALGNILAYSMVIYLLLCTAPAIIMILLLWWIIAWILGLIFPGKEFFPIEKIWDSVSQWVNEHLNVDLGIAAFIAGIILLISSIFGEGSSNKD